MMKIDIPAAALPLLSSRKAIQHASIYPLIGITVTALLFALISWQHAVGVALAGGTVVIGNWLAARVALGKGQVQGAGSALLRLLAAVMIKWALLIALLSIGLVGWQLPPIALLVGLVVGLALQMRALVRR